MSTRILWLPLLAVGIVYLPCAIAEDSLRADTPTLDTRIPEKRAPLSGKVSVEQTHTRADAHKAGSTAAVAPAVVAPKTAPAPNRVVPARVVVAPARVAPAPIPKMVAVPPHSVPLNGFANDFGGFPMQGMLDHRHHRMRGFNNYNPYAMQLQAQAQKPKWTNPDDAPYRWGQCGTGGYYDTTGIYKGPMVWGDKLAALGGRFFDGTPVPKGPVQINAMGHIWWQNKLSQNFVKKDDLRKQGFNE